MLVFFLLTRVCGVTWMNSLNISHWNFIQTSQTNLNIQTNVLNRTTGDNCPTLLTQLTVLTGSILWGLYDSKVHFGAADSAHSPKTDKISRSVKCVCL